MAILRGGIDLGGTKIEAIVVDAKNNVRGSARHPTPTEGGPSDVAASMIAALSEAAAQAGTDTKALVGVGVGSPGSVDTASGRVASARNLPGWEGSFALGNTLTKQLGAPTFIANDVQAGTRGEFVLGAGKPYKSVLGLFWGTGVGGGIVLGGEPYRGRGGAGEIGHLVYKPGGRRCGCGNRGCVEAYAGRASLETKARKEIKKGAKSDLVKIAKKKQHEHFTSAVWADAVKKGDKLATQLIDGGVEAIGVGLASALNLLDIEAVIIGGGLGVRFGQEYVERIVAAAEPHLFPGHAAPTVKLASLGDLGGALGAALLVPAKPAAKKPARKPAARPSAA
ncbi:MAG: ROK family protein [Solirubrobacterales bacterium]|nr:ROK family protein [Solirubrobacterales bacterium]